MLFEGKSKPTSTYQLVQSTVNELAQAIESGKEKALFSYLETMARFHSYSARNAILIAGQCPEARHVEGARSWRELGRSVRPGQKGIFILAPAVVPKKSSDVERTNGKLKDKNAPAAKPEPSQPDTQLLGFRGVYVFDIAQTSGTSELLDAPKRLDVSAILGKLLALAEAKQFTIEYSDSVAPAKATSYRGNIRLLPNMKDDETLPALLREIASQLLYGMERRTFVTRALHQQEAKAVSFMVCEALGLEHKRAFSDCQLYYGDSRLLTESLEVVHRSAAEILAAVSTEHETAKAAEVKQ
ncbi:MAG TPA: ArdC family protein [Candidatus Angelobacter sp.]|nr:ArdC family protein [Candidatus Angelobacter sp.]